MTDHVVYTALKLVGAGLSVIPIGAHKRPAISSWKDYQTRLPTPEEWIAWVASRRCGLAIVFGAVSRNTEVIDIDDTSVLRPYYDLLEAVAPGLVARLVIVKTPRNGRHLYYRCSVIEGNQKLAVNAQRQTMIETRGPGGYALIPPSPPWCHPDHKPYELRQGDLAHIQTITPDERDILRNCARALTQYVEPERVYTPRTSSTTGDRPGDVFAVKVPWEDILLPHGWRVVGHRGEVTRWCRPGKRDGLSATTGWGGYDMLYIFSSNARPFEPETGYSKFHAFALLNYRGDFRKAATALAAIGYVVRHDGRSATTFKGYGAYRAYGTFGAYRGAVSRG